MRQPTATTERERAKHEDAIYCETCGVYLGGIDRHAPIDEGHRCVPAPWAWEELNDVPTPRSVENFDTNTTLAINCAPSGRPSVVGSRVTNGWIVCAFFPPTGSDGKSVVVEVSAAPARFYRLHTSDGVVISTGTGEETLVVQLARRFAEGMLGNGQEEGR